MKKYIINALIINALFSLGGCSDERVGPTGPAGVSGATGSSGANGADGEIGPAGYTGGVGAIGPAGSGATGATGPAGADGTTGATGATGPAGAAGSLASIGVTISTDFIRGTPNTVWQIPLLGLTFFTDDYGRKYYRAGSSTTASYYPVNASRNTAVADIIFGQIRELCDTLGWPRAVIVRHLQALKEDGANLLNGSGRYNLVNGARAFAFTADLLAVSSSDYRATSATLLFDLRDLPLNRIVIDEMPDAFRSGGSFEELSVFADVIDLFHLGVQVSVQEDFLGDIDYISPLPADNSGFTAEFGSFIDRMISAIS